MVLTRPIPTVIMHFTHMDHLPTILHHGLRCDALAQDQLLKMEAGNPGIKTRRRRAVPQPPYGVVADYVPFYFAPRSPMMSAISYGRVPEYEGTVEDLIYLVTDTQMLTGMGLTLLCTDRNATLDVAEFRSDAASDDLVDWELMLATWWNNTADEPDRRERRMAECLVHDAVPFGSFREIVVHGPKQARVVSEMLAASGGQPPVAVRPQWYI